MSNKKSIKEWNEILGRLDKVMGLLPEESESHAVISEIMCQIEDAVDEAGENAPPSLKVSVDLDDDQNRWVIAVS